MTVGEKLGFTTTRAAISAQAPKTSDLGRHGQSAVTDAAAVKQACAAGRENLNTLATSYKTQHETACREFNGSLNTVAHNHQASAYQLARGAAGNASTSGADVVANAIPVANTAGLIADLVGDRSAMSKGKVKELAAEAHQKLASAAHTARQQVETGIIPEGKQRTPAMDWDKIEPEEALEYIATPIEEQPEMKMIQQAIAEIDEVEGNLELALVKVDDQITSDKVASALERGDEQFLKKAIKVDPEMVLTEVELMGDSLPYGVRDILAGHACYLDANICHKIKQSIPEIKVAAAAPAKPDNDLMAAPNPFANTTPVDRGDNQSA